MACNTLLQSEREAEQERERERDRKRAIKIKKKPKKKELLTPVKGYTILLQREAEIRKKGKMEIYL